MTKKLDWTKLLCNERVRASSTNGNNSRQKDDKFYDHRNEFDKDYDRIVYSSSLRRLQDKAQVFPLQINDFTRTRLTHSIEASALARSLGYAVGEWLLEEKEFDNYRQVRELSALLQVSALIHDLGNPPFGHYGEDIIRNWFENWFESEDNKTKFFECQSKSLQKYEEKLIKEGKLDEKEKLSEEKIKYIVEQQINDLKNFEGNAQTLRIVSKLQLLNDENGVNFTYATLATIMKYPWDSNSEQGKSKKKFAYFYSEEELSNKVLSKVGLKKEFRHPVTYLLEASDDMAYLLADVEDAVKKGIISWDKEYEEIKGNIIKKIKANRKIDDDKALNLYKEIYGDMFSGLDYQMEINKLNEIPECNLANIQNFKVRAQGLMFKEVVSMFKQNYKSIMNCEYGIKNLLEESEVKELVQEMQRLAYDYCYPNKEVLTLELVGDEVINGLLDKFVDALAYHEDVIETKKREGKLYSIISDNFKFISRLDENSNKVRRKSDPIKSVKFEDVDMYKRLLLITDFISGMTDSYAVNLYKELTGVKLP
jgi:dGTPase